MPVIEKIAYIMAILTFIAMLKLCFGFVKLSEAVASKKNFEKILNLFFLFVTFGILTFIIALLTKSLWFGLLALILPIFIPVFMLIYVFHKEAY